MKLTWLYYLPCCVLLGALTACGQDPAISADEKLSPIISQIPPPHKPVTEPTVVAPLVYQSAKDPFVNPYRTAPSSANTPNTPSAASDHTASRPSSQPDPDATKPNDGDVAKESNRSFVRESSAAIANHPSTHQPAPKGKRVRIDSSRVRQPLEHYDLQMLKYQGILSDHSRTMALIASPDGRIHEVMVGQYLGRHHGRVVDINADRIELAEAVLAEDGHYYHRQSMLTFIHK